MACRKIFWQYKELDILIEQKFKKQNPINWETTNRFICGFHLPTAASNFPSEKITTFLDFKNIFSSEIYSIQRT